MVALLKVEGQMWTGLSYVWCGRIYGEELKCSSMRVSCWKLTLSGMAERVLRVPVGSVVLHIRRISNFTYSGLHGELGEEEIAFWRVLVVRYYCNVEAAADIPKSSLSPVPPRQVSIALYKRVHAYVRMRLQEVYPGRIDPKGPIPAHILGLYRQTKKTLSDFMKKKGLLKSSRFLHT